MTLRYLEHLVRRVGETLGLRLYLVREDRQNVTLWINGQRVTPWMSRQAMSAYMSGLYDGYQITRKCAGLDPDIYPWAKFFRNAEGGEH